MKKKKWMLMSLLLSAVMLFSVLPVSMAEEMQVMSECTHPARGSSLKCSECGVDLVAEVSLDQEFKQNVTYYDSLQKAIESVPKSSDWYYVRLLRNITVDQTITMIDQKIIFCTFMNNKLFFEPYAALLVGSGSTLSFNSFGYIGDVTIGAGGKAILADDAQIGSLIVLDGGAADFYNGVKFEIIELRSENGKLSDLLFSKEYGFMMKNGSDYIWLADDSAAMQGKLLMNVRVAFKNRSAITNPPTARDLAYNGGPQELLDAGTADGGTIYYSLDGQNYSPEIPKGTEVQDYTVWYKVVGSAGYQDTSPEFVSVQIKKMEIGYKIICKTKFYNGLKDAAEVESVTFFDRYDQLHNLISIPEDEYTITPLRYEEVDVGPSRWERKKVSGELSLVPGSAADRHYDIHPDLKLVYGYIEPAKLPNCENATVYLKYNDVSPEDHPKEYDISVFGSGADHTCTIGWDGVTFLFPDPNNRNEYIQLYRLDTENKKIRLRLKKELPKEILSTEYNRFVAWITVESADKNYISRTGETGWNNEDRVRFTVRFVERYTPVISYQPSYDFVYTGEDILPSALNVTATCNTQPVAGSWSWEGDAPKEVSDAKNYTLVFTPENPEDYETVKTTVTVAVVPINIENNPDIRVSVTPEYLLYSGKADVPGVQVMFGETILTENTDYTVNYPQDKTSVGEKTVSIQGVGHFAGTVTHSYAVRPYDGPLDFTLSQTEFTYDGNEKRPEVSATDNRGNTFLPDGNYQVSYRNNQNAGTAYAIVSNVDSGNCTLAQTVEIPFTINPAAPSIKTAPAGKANLIYSGQEQELIDAGTTADGTLEYSLDGISFSADIPKGTDAKTYPVWYRIVGDQNHKNSDPERFEVTIAQKEITDAVLALDGTLTYNGTEQEQHVNVTLDGFALTYDVTDNKATDVKTDGNYLLKVTGNGNFTGEKTLEFNLLPAEPKENPDKLTTARLRRGSALAQANITGGEFFGVDGTTVLSGSFAWVNDTKILRADASEEMIFTPNDSNYTSVRLNAAVETYATGGSLGGGSAGTIRYTVSFESNGGERIESQTVTKNSTVKEPAEPIREGYTFAGWYIDPALEKPYDFTQKVIKSFTLYAAWKEEQENQIILKIGEKEAIVFGKTVQNDVAPIIRNDRTMLPARFVAEQLGAEVFWDDENRTVTIRGTHLKTGETVTIEIRINREYASVNGEQLPLDAPAMIENDRTYTPTRFVAEQLGASVEWNETEQTVLITKP